MGDNIYCDLFVMTFFHQIPRYVCICILSYYSTLAVSTRPPDGVFSARPAGLYSLGPCGPLSGGGKEFY